MKSKDKDVFSPWVERDLIQDALSGQLGFVHDRGSTQSTADLVRCGRSVIVSGEPGVGKTSLVRSVLRSFLSGEEAREWRRRRLLQVSLQRGAATVTRNGPSVTQLFLELIDGVAAAGESTMVFIRDLHLAWGLDLEDEISNLAMQSALPVIGEGATAGIRVLLADTRQVEQHYSLVWVTEPDLSEVRSILVNWANSIAQHEGTIVEPGGVDAAVELSNRFLSRSRMPRKALAPLQQLAASRGPETAGRIDRTDVVDYFCRQYELPRVLADSEEEFDLDRLESRLNAKVLGQPRAVTALVDAVAKTKSGLVADDRPCGVFLFTGPTGVGKTFLVKSLARELFGWTDRTVRLNMADFRDPKSVRTLFGVPSAYSRIERDGVLVTALRSHQFGILLLDEFDKAAPEVHDRFLQLFDEGVLTTEGGEQMTCRSFLIVATSNAGIDVWKRNAAGYTAENGRDEKLRQLFRFELLNRFDEVVHFDLLSRCTLRRLVASEIGRVEERSGLARQSIELSFDDDALDWLVERGVDDKHGARLLRRTVERFVTAPIARLALRRSLESCSSLALSVVEGDLHFELRRGVEELGVAALRARSS